MLSICVPVSIMVLLMLPLSIVQLAPMQTLFFIITKPNCLMFLYFPSLEVKPNPVWPMEVLFCIIILLAILAYEIETTNHKLIDMDDDDTVTDPIWLGFDDLNPLRLRMPDMGRPAPKVPKVIVFAVPLCNPGGIIALISKVFPITMACLGF